jgi:hypothetical protein
MTRGAWSTVPSESTTPAWRPLPEDLAHLGVEDHADAGVELGPYPLQHDEEVFGAIWRTLVGT